MTVTMRTLKRASRQQLIDLKKSKKNATDAIKALRKELEIMLDKIEEQTLQELENEYQKIASERMKEQTDADNTVELLRKLEDQMRQAGENRSQRFLCMKLADANIVDVNKMSTEVRRSSVQQLAFVPCGSLSDLLQQLHHLGEIIASSKIREEIYKIKESKYTRIKLPNDTKQCLSYGSCLTEDGMLLVTDYRNKKLKRVGVNILSVVDDCDLLDAPFGVCCMNKHEAVVACETNTVQFVKLNKSITLSRKMRLNHVCFGIAFNNRKLYIADNNGGVYIYDMSGTLLKKVTYDKDGESTINL